MSKSKTSSDGASGLMLVLSAPSGTGKTTVARRIAKVFPDAIFSVSVTTRKPRGKEKEGVDYHFVDDPTFQRMKEEGELLEWAKVHGSCYGTPARYAKEATERGRLVLFDIDVQGGRQIKAKHPEAATILLLPPSMEELERRLRARGTDDEDTIQRRLAAAVEEMAEGKKDYDFVVVNETLEETHAVVSAIVRTMRGIGDPGDRRLAEESRLARS